MPYLSASAVVIHYTKRRYIKYMHLYLLPLPLIGRSNRVVVADCVRQDMVKDIEKLKWKLMEKDKDADKAMMAGRRTGSTLQKSRSLEDGAAAAAAAADTRTHFEHQFDLRMQLETVPLCGGFAYISLRFDCRSIRRPSDCLSKVVKVTVT